MLPRRNRGRRGEASGDWLAELTMELERSRRYERPFVLIRVPSEGARVGARSDGCGRLQAALRSGDHCWSAAGSIYLLLPESTRRMAEGLLERMRASFPDLALDQAQLACFPDDALTGGALLDAVTTRVRHLAPASELPRLREAASGG